MSEWLRSSACLFALTAGCLAAPLPAAAGEPDRAAGGEADRPNAAPAAEARHPVLEKRDIPYYDAPDADPRKHLLDLYVPRDVRDYPVVLFVHGGAWMIGDKNDFGIYAGIGRMLASHGIGMVSANYRLSPKVQHPEHVKDVARAFSWTRRHIAEYGGNPQELFVCGHSAGGHLVALLATDESYLKAEGLSLADIRGAMPISGAYAIPPNMFKEVFGTDAEQRRLAGPLQHVGAGCPPFLISYADQDFPSCDVVSEQFCKALQAQGVSAETLPVKRRTHLDIIGKVARDEDPLAQALRAFVAKHAAARAGRAQSAP